MGGAGVGGAGVGGGVGPGVGPGPGEGPELEHCMQGFLKTFCNLN